MSQPTTIPVHVLTGFLGSGKTTLLNCALQAGFGPETAVVVNEFGDVGLDQLFVQARSEETIVLKSGCVCCTIRADLASTLLQLLSARGPSAPPFRRILIETSGISDPLPILQTLRSEFNLLTRFRVGSVVCTVDAFDAASALSRPEGLAQVTTADAIVITKGDIADGAQVAAARDAAAALNPLAEIIEAKGDALVDWLARCEAQDDAPDRALRMAAPRTTSAQGHGVSSIVLRAPFAPAWPLFAVWLTRLIFLHGDRILRVKGILFDSDRGTWIGIHGVRRFFHPPVHLALNEPSDCGACLVFITEGLDPSLIERSYQDLLEDRASADTIGHRVPLGAAKFGSGSSAQPREQMVARALMTSRHQTQANSKEQKMNAMKQKAGGIFLAGAILLMAQDASAQNVRWRASGSFPASHSTAIAMETFKSEVARLSKNTIQVDLFPGNTLGGAFEQVDQLRTGQIQMAWGGLSFYDKLVPEFAAAALPFAATSMHQAICQIEGDLGRFLEERAAEKGILLLGLGNIGARHVTNNRRPIKTVEDLRGLKIRTPSGDAWNLTFRAVGANPTPIDIGELYQALQQGLVDGQENPYDNMLVRKFFQVQKYVSNTGHFFDWSGYMVNKAAFEQLKPEQQKAVKDAMFTAVAVQRAISDRENKTALDGLIKGGMQYDALSPAEIAKFREATRSVYTEVRKRAGDKAIDLAEAAIKQCQ